MVFIQSSIEINAITVQTRKLQTPVCSLCNEEMEFVEGDTIYGDKWYHNTCWKALSTERDYEHQLN